MQPTTARIKFMNDFVAAWNKVMNLDILYSMTYRLKPVG